MLAKNTATFLFTDDHVVSETFLELINNMLTINMVPGLFQEEVAKELVASEQRQQLPVTPFTNQFVWEYFLN